MHTDKNTNTKTKNKIKNNTLVEMTKPKEMKQFIKERKKRKYMNREQ
jgi:hypothetical protein